MTVVKLVETTLPVDRGTLASNFGGVFDAVRLVVVGAGVARSIFAAVHDKCLRLSDDGIAFAGVRRRSWFYLIGERAPKTRFGIRSESVVVQRRVCRGLRGRVCGGLAVAVLRLFDSGSGDIDTFVFTGGGHVVVNMETVF